MLNLKQKDVMIQNSSSIMINLKLDNLKVKTKLGKIGPQIWKEYGIIDDFNIVNCPYCKIKCSENILL